MNFPDRLARRVHWLHGVRFFRQIAAIAGIGAYADPELEWNVSDAAAGSLSVRLGWHLYEELRRSERP